MNQKHLWSAVLATLMLAVVPAMAQQEEAPPADEPADQVEEVIVITASRTSQPLNEAPAAISVLTAKDIESIPADNYGSLLRNVPGLNVSQTSARDINMTSRGSTNTSPGSGRSSCARPGTAGIPWPCPSCATATSASSGSW